VSPPPAHARERFARSSQLESEPKYGAQHRPTGSANVPSRESLRTDSRVLRLMRCFDAPENAFCAKIILRCEVGGAGIVAREKIRRERSRLRRAFSSR
jgi:hypothetical protein